MKCDTNFCLKCEKIKRDEHKCKETDVQNIEFLKTISQCPNCKIPIEKSEGCRSMKCANCHTMFDYYTKDKADHGGSNKDINIKEKIKLSNEYKKIYSEEIIKLLMLFEQTIPTVDFEKNNQKILNIVTEYVSNGKTNTEEYSLKVSMIYSKICLFEYKYKVTLNKISEIEDLHEHNELTYSNLKKIINGKY